MISIAQRLHWSLLFCYLLIEQFAVNISIIVITEDYRIGWIFIVQNRQAICSPGALARRWRGSTQHTPMGVRAD